MNPTGASKCRLTWGSVRRLSCLTSGWRFWHFDFNFYVLASFSSQFPPNIPTSTYKRGTEPNVSWSKKCSKFSLKLIKQHIFKAKCMCCRKSMHEKESKMVVRFELKIPSLGITVRHHSSSLVMPNSYSRDAIFNPNRTTVKESYIL